MKLKPSLIVNAEFAEVAQQLNEEILRRGTFAWWDPLTIPDVGQDRTPPLNLPCEDENDNRMRQRVSVETYTINQPSKNSIEPTRNTMFPAHGLNPARQPLNRRTGEPRDSANRWDVDEAKNFLVGLAKMRDINLYYGRDEQAWLAFRNPTDIGVALDEAQRSRLNRPLMQSSVPNPERYDPNGGVTHRKSPTYGPYPDVDTGKSATFQLVNGVAVMPSGEFDGEEGKPHAGNFYDDTGNWNPFVSERVDRSHNNRNSPTLSREEGGVPSSPRFGETPRNPRVGNQYRPRPVFGGVIGICNVACTGLCYQTCDNECSESCTSTCWNRCGNACTATCGNICTGCNTMCFTSCKTKCSTELGMACLDVGAHTVQITKVGAISGSSGEPDGPNWPANKISYTTYSCNGCSYTCQFWPNKRTTCTDSGCEGSCFTSCTESCSASCLGGCIDNPNQNTEINGTFKTGIGRACSDGCVMNCIGTCSGVCEGECIQACWHACKSLCADNCTWKCWTICGHGCTNHCTMTCTGCSSCTGTCTGEVAATGCVGCGAEGGCSLECRHGCNTNCMGWGCRSICGIGPAEACSSNCRLNCTASSCTSLCSDACSSQCTTCANNCGFNCGPCTSQCSTGCGAECNITCVADCSNNCTDNCVQSCSEDCGGCSDLCYSCIGMCIGTCSVKCQDGCSNCANQCGWWCDTACNRACFNNCDDRCLMTCVGSCISFLASYTTSELDGPERPPTAEGYIYPFPENRDQERASFRFRTEEVIRPPRPPEEDRDGLIWIDQDTEYEIMGADGNMYTVICNRVVVEVHDDIVYTVKSTVLIGGVWTVVEENGDVFYISEATVPELQQTYPNIGDGEGIILVILHFNPDVPLDPEKITTRLPFGFMSQPTIVAENGDLVVIIQRKEYVR